MRTRFVTGGIACSVILFRINPVSAAGLVILPDYVFGGRTRTAQITRAMFLCTPRRRRRRRPLKTTYFYFFFTVHTRKTLSTRIHRSD